MGEFEARCGSAMADPNYCPHAERHAYAEAVTREFLCRGGKITRLPDGEWIATDWHDWAKAPPIGMPLARPAELSPSLTSLLESRLRPEVLAEQHLRGVMKRDRLDKRVGSVTRADALVVGVEKVWGKAVIAARRRHFEWTLTDLYRRGLISGGEFGGGVYYRETAMRYLKSADAPLVGWRRDNLLGLTDDACWARAVCYRRARKALRRAGNAAVSAVDRFVVFDMPLRGAGDFTSLRCGLAALADQGIEYWAEVERACEQRERLAA